MFVAQHFVQNELVHGNVQSAWFYPDPHRQQPVDDHSRLYGLPLGREIMGEAPARKMTPFSPRGHKKKERIDRREGHLGNAVLPK